MKCIFLIRDFDFFYNPTFPTPLTEYIRTSNYIVPFQVKNIMDHESNTDYDCSTDVEQPITEYRSNSNPQNFIDIRGESPIFSLTETYVLTRAIIHWDGLKYAYYSTQEARLKSFVIHDWPQGLNAKPNALSDAGFLKRRTYILFWFRQNIRGVLSLHSFHNIEYVYRFERSGGMLPLC